MPRRLLALAALGAALLVVGCGDRRHPGALHGSWRLTDEEASSPSGVKLGREQLRKLFQDFPTVLTLKPGGQMSESINGLQRAGTWQVEGDHLRISFTSGTPAAPEDTPYRVEEDGRRLRRFQPGVVSIWQKQP